MQVGNIQLGIPVRVLRKQHDRQSIKNNTAYVYDGLYDVVCPVSQETMFYWSAKDLGVHYHVLFHRNFHRKLWVQWSAKDLGVHYDMSCVTGNYEFSDRPRILFCIHVYALRVLSIYPITNSKSVTNVHSRCMFIVSVTVTSMMSQYHMSMMIMRSMMMMSMMSQWWWW